MHDITSPKIQGNFKPSNLPMAAVGGAMLYMGWFGFNAGSALSSSGLAALVVANTHVAASASAVIWMLIEGCRRKVNVIQIMNGAVAGLAGVTPAAGYITNDAALVLGIILGFARCVGSGGGSTPFHPLPTTPPRPPQLH